MGDDLLSGHLKSELIEALASVRVVNIVGPRQFGKTALIRDLFGKGHFITLDDEGVLMAVDSDPLGQLELLTAKAVDGEIDRTLVVFEIKAAATVGESDLRHLRWFKSEGPGRTWNVTGILIYLGDQPLSFGDRLFALPLSIFLAFNRATR